MIPIKRIMPRNRIIRGDADISRLMGRYRPAAAARIPETRPISNRRDHSTANRAEIEAGRIRNANIVNTPAISTASITKMLKEKKKRKSHVFLNLMSAEFSL
jgi:hypothetical protein